MVGIDPDEIFLDSSNLPEFDRHQFEGRIEKSISKKTIVFLSFCFLILGLVFLGRTGWFQIVDGKVLAERAARNSLRHTYILAPRGIIYDRNGEELAFNNPSRAYAARDGLAHLLGYTSFPTAEEVERRGVYSEEYVGREGVERVYDETLRGHAGLKVVEVDVEGSILSESVLEPARGGGNITLSVDAPVQGALYNYIKESAQSMGYRGGAGVLMDIETGEVIALTSYPEYDPTQVEKYLEDPRNALLNRAVSGLYAPGSIVKPIMAAAALNEGIISPAKQILSTAYISIPNPFHPGEVSTFREFKPRGWVDMRRALALSSNIYFYTIGGGYGGQKGLGIDKINEYARKFGLGEKTGIDLLGEEEGNVPSREWKEKVFSEKWLLGDTYNTSIGQYGYQVTPLQMARVAAAVATNGKLVIPTVLKAVEPPFGGSTAKFEQIPISPEHFQVVREGMRAVVTEGTGQLLNLPQVKVAAKSGTAEVGVGNKFINSWTIGFFPYEAPKYAFAIVMERSPNLSTGGTHVARNFIEWLSIYKSDYLGVK